MKKIIAAALVTSAMLALGACGAAEEVKEVIGVKKDADTYIAEHNALVDKQVALSTKIEEQFINVEDYDQSLANLSDQLIPEFEAYVEEVKSYSYESPEIQEVYQYFVDAMVLQLEVLREYEAAMLAEDDALFMAADAKIDEVNALLVKNEEGFQALAAEYDINVEFEAEAETPAEEKTE